ncbi:hypothetical protein BKA66DRAFT_572335 [Pyrenochaeta sp. MPI-SDFR-AT-0127]|nr:hypothetical protein BKA66DRAFT_572335 [Pyrenochaeta sp. MPI-SDFR-AT-0127]
MPSLFCLVYILTSKEPSCEVIEIIPKVWNAKWKYKDDTAVYDYRLTQCKHPDTPDAIEHNTVVKFRFNKSQDLKINFSWFKDRGKAEAAMNKALQEVKTEAAEKGQKLEWTIQDGNQETGMVGRAGMLGLDKGKNIWWNVLEVTFEHLESLDEG